VLPLAARIGEAEVNELDVVLLDHVEDFFRVGHLKLPFVPVANCVVYADAPRSRAVLAVAGRHEIWRRSFKP
jgi:hypothetical protein